MLFSVIIPAYNCKRDLQRTVESVMQSGLFDYEILIVDDGSTDGTSELCDALQSRYGVIRCLHQKNAGVSAARNCGISASTAEYLVFFDSDDCVDPGSLNNAARIAKRIMPDMLVFGLSFDYYFHGKLYRRDNLVYTGEGLMSREQWSVELADLFRCNALSPVWNKLIRRELVIRNRLLFREDLIEMEDFHFVIRCMSHCSSIYFLPEVIYRYRQSEAEKNTYNRLLRIPSLSAYMQPFEAGLQELTSHIDNGETVAQDIVGQIYTSLFQEQIRFGDIPELKRAAADMLSGTYSETVKKSNPSLFQSLKKGKYTMVWCQSAGRRLRHWLAVRVKYLKNHRRA